MRKPFFPHDKNSRDDPKILELRAEFGAEGYGIFWMIVESMMEDDGGAFDPKLIKGCSINFTAKPSIILAVLERCLALDIFFNKDGKAYSKRVIKELEKMVEFYEKKAEAGRRGGLAKAKNLANPSSARAMLSKSYQKRREEKRKNTILLRSETEPLFLWITEKCNELNIENKVKLKTLDLYIEKYIGKVKLRISLDGYLIWMFDQGKRVLNSSAVGNCFKRELDRQKKEELKQQHLAQDGEGFTRAGDIAKTSNTPYPPKENE